MKTKDCQATKQYKAHGGQLVIQCGRKTGHKGHHRLKWMGGKITSEWGSVTEG